MTGAYLSFNYSERAPFDEALKRDPENKRQWVIVVDGHPHQLSSIEKLMAGKKVDAMIIMDFIHVLEYLWKAVYCLYEKGSEAAESWVCEQLYECSGENPQEWPERHKTKCQQEAAEKARSH